MRSFTTLIIGMILTVVAQAQLVSPDVTAKKLAEATPPAFADAESTGSSDAAIDRVKGEVKSILLEIEETDATGVTKRRRSSETFFNRRGDKTKQIYYNYFGDPQTVTIYGYIDGDRVSKTGVINYENYPHSQPNIPRADPLQDPRYDGRWARTFDSNGKITKIEQIYAGKKTTNHATYTYTPNGFEELWFVKRGELWRKKVVVLDLFGGETSESIYSNAPRPGSDVFHFYTYNSFDSIRNWTKRLVTTKSNPSPDSPGTKYTQHRTITYW